MHTVADGAKCSISQSSGIAGSRNIFHLCKYDRSGIKGRGSLEVYSNNNDGFVSFVKLKTRKGELTRPVNKIVLLEAADEDQNNK